ncbi:hypothetical protein BLJ79_04230 [Arthrobacter sp. UCD-GKA]|uniref:hypothetical protein n=1 Tax=Arthrobacter sp. UCD-GKA TaxID=1913576 RepID=UPI0008DC773E|nr:hypothetical protein [Arthrobacter sp. UCD-GKA]OIH86009.1 hypothetical protein BLJ79_04230 [Arthrobacter sp. UCD-GKA]
MSKIRAGALTQEHIGKTITVKQRETTITGVLRGFTIMGNLIDDTQFGDHGVTRWAVGNVTVRVAIVPDIEASFDSRATVELA